MDAMNIGDIFSITSYFNFSVCQYSDKKRKKGVHHVCLVAVSNARKNVSTSRKYLFFFLSKRRFKNLNTSRKLKQTNNIILIPIVTTM